MVIDTRCNSAYLGDFPNEVFRQHLVGVFAVTHILENGGSVKAGVFQDDVVSTWVLRK